MFRLLGDIEKLCSVKNDLGYYRCVAVTAEYTSNLETQDLAFAIEVALSKVIPSHPALSAGILFEDTDYPVFVRLKSIDVSKCVEYRDVIAPTVSEYNAALEGILERQHSKSWGDLSFRPAWKVVVVQSKALPSNQTRFDVVFAYHHSIGDGISGLIFHRSLLGALNSPPAVDTLDRHVQIPGNLRLPRPLEDQIKFENSFRFLLREYFKAYKPSWLRKPQPWTFNAYKSSWLRKPKPWTSNICELRHVQNYISHTKIMSFSAEQLAVILTACRKENATITGLLHGVIVASLTWEVAGAMKFKGGTPYSLRPLLEESSQSSMGSFSWGYTIPYAKEVISKIDSCNTDSDLNCQIWDIARRFRVSTARELLRLPNDNYIGLLPYVKQLHRALRGKIGQPRPETFEVSNIGAFQNGTDANEWKIQKMVFSQSGMGIGPLISFNVVSVAGGPLTICATWLEGAIQERHVNLVCGDIAHLLNTLSSGDAEDSGMKHPPHQRRSSRNHGLS